MNDDQNKAAAMAKGNVVVADKSDKRLWNPASKCGSCCGLTYVFCGCCCCDFNMLIGALCCTKMLMLLGAVPVALEDGSCGAMCAAGSMDCVVDKAIGKCACIACCSLDTFFSCVYARSHSRP